MNEDEYAYTCRKCGGHYSSSDERGLPRCESCGASVDEGN